MKKNEKTYTEEFKEGIIKFGREEIRSVPSVAKGIFGVNKQNVRDLLKKTKNKQDAIW